MNEWMSEWMNEWMNEWVNEWMNEWILAVEKQISEIPRPSSVSGSFKAWKTSIFFGNDAGCELGVAVGFTSPQAGASIASWPPPTASARIAGPYAWCWSVKSIETRLWDGTVHWWLRRVCCCFRVNLPAIVQGPSPGFLSLPSFPFSGKGIMDIDFCFDCSNPLRTYCTRILSDGRAGSSNWNGTSIIPIQLYI